MDRSHGETVERVAHEITDARQRDFAAKKRLHGDFIGRVERGSARAAAANDAMRQRDGGEAIKVDGLEVERAQRGEIEFARRAVKAQRIAQRLRAARVARALNRRDIRQSRAPLIADE